MLTFCEMSFVFVQQTNHLVNMNCNILSLQNDTFSQNVSSLIIFYSKTYNYELTFVEKMFFAK